MISHKYVEMMEHSEVLPGPLESRKIYPDQLCPFFCEQRRAMVPTVEECFFCQYGDFHKMKAEVLEVGTCCYPVVQIR